METSTTITRTTQIGSARTEFLFGHFGRHFLLAERYVYAMARRLMPSYDGGYWEYYTLSNGALYFGLTGQPRITVESMNGFKQEISTDAASIVVALFALGVLLEQLVGVDDDGAEKVSDYYYGLRAYALENAECDAILKAID